VRDADLDMVIRPYADGDEAAVVRLWNECKLIAPANDPRADIAAKVQIQPGLFLVGEIDGRVVATVMAGYEGHRGWINYLAVAPDIQRRGIGRQMMIAAETQLRALGCPKINLQVRTANPGVIGFYRHLGFDVDDVTSLGKRLD
jgi:ribosomal protein S18 acetylase RimI-like enzyme